MPLPQGFSASGRAAASFEDLMDRGSTSKLTQMVVGRTQLLTGCWDGGLSPSWVAGRSSLIRGPSSRVAHGMASGFHQNSRARG